LTDLIVEATSQLAAVVLVSAADYVSPAYSCVNKDVCNYYSYTYFTYSYSSASRERYALPKIKKIKLQNIRL